MLAAAFVMSRFDTSPYSTRFEKSHGNTGTETLISDRVSGNHFAIPGEYSVVEFGKHLDVVPPVSETTFRYTLPEGHKRQVYYPFCSEIHSYLFG